MSVRLVALDFKKFVEQGERGRRGGAMAEGGGMGNIGKYKKLISFCSP